MKNLSYDPLTGIFRWLRAPPRKPSFVGAIAGYKNASGGYRYIKIAGKSIPEHRLAWEYVYGPVPPGLELDHINGVRDDNRIANLRLATRASNCANSVRTLGKSGYRGVNRHKGGLYRARVGRGHLLGYFKTPEEAAAAYDAEAIRRYGPCAKTNAQQ